MILKKISSNKESFKTVEFTRGFNVILAERHSEASERDSRNGLGKTTLVEIIHFCLGSDLSRSPLNHDELKEWSFSLEFSVGNNDYVVTRDLLEPNSVIVDGDISFWPSSGFKIEKDTRNPKVPLSEWKNILAYLIFNISEEDKILPYAPSFRGLVSYFARRGNTSYQDPFKFFPAQSAWSVQVLNCYLLGLGWEYAVKFQELKDKIEEMEGLKKVTGQGYFEDIIGSIGELNSQRITKTEEIRQYESDLKEYKVHPEYYSLQEKADLLTERIKAFTNDRYRNLTLIKRYQEAIREETDASLGQVEDVYKEAGLRFSDTLRHSLEEVTDFHKHVIENRRSYLSSEISRLEEKNQEVEKSIEELAAERGEILSVLHSHGALDEYAKLTERLALLQKELEGIKTKIKNLSAIEDAESDLQIKRTELIQETRQDNLERTEFLEEAIRSFNNYSRALYSQPGNLSVDITPSGFRFKVDIERAASQGIGYMKVFCYDLTINKIQSKFFNPKFLLHDSTIFDGVDERQFAKALELAADESEANNSQYICTLNSDVVPFADFSHGFQARFENSIKLRLNDTAPENTLLGVRF